MTTLNEIRSLFLNYFNHHGHEIVQSSPLVPLNDPSLMFANSGMVQFKNLFTGVETRSYKRAVTAQKCVRAGGKHNDLDNVGYTARHHTFFEMLGNFSFGDYFKDAAIPFAWELITKEFALPKERLYITVYHTDDEAFQIWKKIGVAENHIIRINSSDNFWQMGPTGPCGPCSEIFYDHGAHIKGGPPGSPDEDGDRFIEIWNIVFMQNEQFEDGSMRDLDFQSIDTGMGLERIAALLQGSHDNYDTDLMRSLIEASAHVTNTEPYGAHNTHHRVIADHLRSMSFLIADGVLPSNEGRGYVLRRIMRRAMRHAHFLGVKEPIMHQLVASLNAQMGQAYPELIEAQFLIEETLLLEETRFKITLERGLALLEDEVAKLKSNAPLSGKTAFKLYDTYGFPLDLTEDVLREKNHTVDRTEFDAEMKAQRAKARAAWVGTGEEADTALWFDLAQSHGESEFLGYDRMRSEGDILAIVENGAQVASAQKGSNVIIIANQTPFYAESGGQIGDKGIIQCGDALLNVTNTQKSAGLHLHICDIMEGDISCKSAEFIVDAERRMKIAAHHSATHLLHEALRETLGEHVAQRGSLNSDARLRFDFSHSHPLSSEEQLKIEKTVNHYIRQNSRVETRVMALSEARALKAQALFGEKYAEDVRVVSMGEKPHSGKGQSGTTYSIELCGGTHVKRTGDIGAFILHSESASSAGVRRIEALTGDAALEYLKTHSDYAHEAAGFFKSPPRDVMQHIRALREENKNLQHEIAQLRKTLALSQGKEDTVETINDIQFKSKLLKDVPAKELRGLIDAEKEMLASAVIILVSEIGGKVAIAAGVTDDLTDKVNAVALVQKASAVLGGKGGGGRADFAQSGGASAADFTQAITAIKQLLED